MRVKKIGWSCLLLVLLLSPGCDHDGTLDEADPDTIEVELIPEELSYHIGETVVVNLWISQADNVGAVPFHLLYDRNILEFVPPAGEGPFMSQGGADTVFLMSDTGGGGELVAGLARLGTKGAQGSGLLVTIVFLAVGQGSSGFEFTGMSVKDPEARHLPATFGVVQLLVIPQAQP